ncbi:MAG: SH3 domain-containing protein [Candidatus Uhrbacteria bacterium]|nr:SH3 domain-containing protein [Candidatus Uhrbacteria bacterium]
MIKKFLIKFFLGLIVIPLFFVVGNSAYAHRSGCHRWHSCPSDSGSYTCGDAGHPCQYPTYPASGGVIYPPSGYYRDYYGGPLKKVPTHATSSSSGIGWECADGYFKKDNVCITHTKNCQDAFGPNVIGVKFSDTESSCSCISGYSASNWVKGGDACVKNTPTPKVGTEAISKVVYIEKGINIRKERGMKGEILATTRMAGAYPYKDESDGWIKIDYNGKIGWVLKSLVIIK